MIKRQLCILALALDGAIFALMTRVESILIYSATSPTNLIPHYYTYLDPVVSLGSGIITAPLAVILIGAALLLLVHAILRPAASVKPAFWLHAAALACVFPVVMLLPVHNTEPGDPGFACGKRLSASPHRLSPDRRIRSIRGGKIAALIKTHPFAGISGKGVCFIVGPSPAYLS